MTQDEKEFSEPTKCGHCGNVAPMEIRATVSQVRSHEDAKSGFPWDEGPVHEILICPACDGIVVRRYYWHESLDPEDVQTEVVYPCASATPVGLPPVIHQELEAAMRVRCASPNAYGVLLGRLLELICDDRGAKKGKLSARLKQLSTRGEIPEKIVELAQKLQALRHVGAHASSGRLTSVEVPILDSLCHAILEYVYSAPYLVRQADARLQELRTRRRSAKGRSSKNGS